MSVLEQLVLQAKARVVAMKATKCSVLRPGPSFVDAIQGKGRLSVIAEFKRCSPGHGELGMDADPVEQASRYAQAGAGAVSVLTEPTRFGGREEDLRRIAATCPVPVLMKDFVVDAVQIRRAAELGASAVLLIARCLPGRQLGSLASVCRDHGMTGLVECHDLDELERALAIQDVVIGINNRNLSTLRIDLDIAPRLLSQVPPERIAVAESGYGSPVEAASLRGLADGVLVGAMLMKSTDPAGCIREISR